MFTFILWCILFVLCWPLAFLGLVLYPLVWLLLLPFRIVGIAVDGVSAISLGNPDVTGAIAARPRPHLRQKCNGPRL